MPSPNDFEHIPESKFRNLGDDLASGATPTSSVQTRPLAVVMVATFKSYDSDQLQAGGRPRIVRDLSRFLVSLGFHVEIVQKGAEDGVTAFESNIVVRKIQAPPKAWGDFAFARRARKSVENADLCCYASPEDGYPFYARNAFAIHHGVWWDVPSCSLWQRLVVRAVNRHRMLTLCRKVKLVLSVDTNVMNWLRLQGNKGHHAAGNCVYLPNYVDSSLVPEATDEKFRSRYSRRRLLFLRRFAPARGGLLFLDLCGELQRRGAIFTAEMVGWGQERDVLNRCIMDKGLVSRVHLASGNLDDSMNLINSCSISVIPTVYSEGTSLSCLESIACGVPVVCTDVGGLGNLVMPGVNGEITRASAASLADGVERIMSSEEEYVRMSKRCQMLATHFSLTLWRERLLHHLESNGLFPLEPAHRS